MELDGGLDFVCDIGADLRAVLTAVIGLNYITELAEELRAEQQHIVTCSGSCLTPESSPDCRPTDLNVGGVKCLTPPTPSSPDLKQRHQHLAVTCCRLHLVKWTHSAHDLKLAS